MDCPECGGRTGVKKTYDYGSEIKRDRACLDCGWRFQTLESCQIQEMKSTIDITKVLIDELHGTHLLLLKKLEQLKITLGE